MALPLRFSSITGRFSIMATNCGDELRPPIPDFLGFASDFAPDQLSDSGKLESWQNGAPNTL